MRYSKISLMIVFSLLASFSCITHAQGEREFSLDDLLQEVKHGRRIDAQDNAQRLKIFKREQSKQQQLLSDIKNEQVAQEGISATQEKTFEANEELITSLEQRLTERLGSLKELFGVLQQVAGDAQGQFSNSIIQLQYPDRSKYLSEFATKMGQTTNLPSIEEIERLWFELQREMTESGKVLRRKQSVVTSEGIEVEKDVVRVGAFNLVADGKYLHFIPETARVIEFNRQPAHRYLAGAEEISKPGSDVVAFTIDPVRGQLLSLLVQAPNFSERIAQGGVIGYFIIVLGIVGACLAIFRLMVLFLVGSRINTQMKHPEQISKNPLGRIFDEYQSHKERDIETLELKLGEAVLREVPKINSGLSFLKIIAAVAPLMGLLGTVTGMIITFQAITLFGTGDPKLMAGGISQALVTTVLGLSVAIPTLLLHNLVQGQARKITEILEQEAVAVIAVQAEKQHSDQG